MKLKDLKGKEDLTKEEILFLLKLYKSSNLYYINIFLGRKKLKYRTKAMEKDLVFLEGKALYMGINILQGDSGIAQHLENRQQNIKHLYLKEQLTYQLENEMELFCFLRNYERTMLEEIGQINAMNVWTYISSEGNRSIFHALNNIETVLKIPLEKS